MRSLFKISAISFLIFTLVGCGESGSSSDSSSGLTIETQKSEINKLKTKMSIDFNIKSDYRNNVTATLSDLKINVTPCTINQVIFTPSSVTFDKNVNEKTVHADVEFASSCEPTAYSLKAEPLLNVDGKSYNVDFNSGSIETTPVVIATVVDDVTDTNSTPIVVGDVKLPIVVIPQTLKETKLTTNSKSIEIPIKVFKDVAPYTSGSVKVELPLKVLTGADVGIFEAYEVTVNSQGIAIFNYTGPSNLKALMDSNDTSSTFKFYHVSNSNNKQSLKVTYDIDADTYIPVDYVLNISTQNNDFSMGIPNLQRTFSVILKDSEGKMINDSDINITKVEIKTENALVAKLINTDTGEAENVLTLKNENNGAFILSSNKLSGVVPIRVTVDFKDLNGQLKTLSTIINVRVMSGPPSAISVSYVSTGQDASRAKYEENFAISVTDEYGNKVNTKPYITLGAIVGYAVDGTSASSSESSSTKRLFYGKSDIESGAANGSINALDDNIANTTEFEDSTLGREDVFKWVNAEGNNTDKLVIFGKGKNYEAMGKWDFNLINNNTLSLQDDYFGLDRTDLYYAVGHNYYQDQCTEDGREWLGSTDSESYQLDDEGTVTVSYKYDYQLMGKDALIWVNLNGYQSDTGKNTRIGEVTRHTLLGQGIKKFPSAGYSLDKNETGSALFEMWHNSVNRRYRNAHFSWRVKEGSSCDIVSYTTSNQYDARTCNNGLSSEGSSYIRFVISAPEDKGCSFDIDQLYISDEF